MGDRSEENIAEVKATNLHNGQPPRERTAHDWEAEKQKHKDLMDDGTMTFFWRAHTITVLVIFSGILFYVSFFEESEFADTDYNTKRGLVAVVLTFILFGVTITPDGPFKRPHPAFWRFILITSIVYELSLVFLLFQNVDGARKLLTYLDENLGKPLPEKSYGGNCRIYDPDNPEDPYHNVWDKMDGFVTVHFFGWWLKTLVLRDYWLCMVMSIMFEILEYTLEHQLPNFSECWWDHWLMDALICNGLGIYLGMKTLNYLSMKPYHWRGMWSIPSYSGKISRILQQFTPYSWTDFDWAPTSSLKRWLCMLIGIGLFLLGELNTFYLKFTLWIPPPHFLCLGRLVFLLLCASVALREAFQFLDDPNCTKIGSQFVLLIAIVVTELLITIKFDYETISKPLPYHISIFWICGLVGLVSWTIWHFYLQRLLTHTEEKIQAGELSNPPSPSKNNNHKAQTTKHGSGDHRVRQRNK